MKLTRRGLLEGAGAISLVAFAPGCGGDDPAGPSAVPNDTLPQYEYDGPLGPETLFTHGVASGDPTPSAVILWTRVSPADGAAVDVWWEISKNEEFTQRVKVGTFNTSEARDFTVKVDATELEAGLVYYYRFKALGRTSPTGRTKTAPSAAVASLRFAMVSCSNFAYGYFHVYRHLASRDDLDAVLHLCDYIYEYGDGDYGTARPAEPPREIVTLDDYRTRHAQYKKDADLQAAHGQFPFITVWDDHETTNDSWKDGAENHQPDTEGVWAERKAVGKQAYFEWMPIRDPSDGNIHRKLSYGPLCDVFMLDTRLEGRDQQLEERFPKYSDVVAANKNLLGEAQERWLLDGLEASTAQWKLLGQQVMIAPLMLSYKPNSAGDGTFANADQWDGYANARKRLLDHVEQKQIGGVVALTGDIHSSWASDVCDDPADPAKYDPATGRGSVLVEFVTPAVTSPGSTILEGVASANKHIKYTNGELRGYVALTLTPERCQAAFWHVEGIDAPELSPLSFSKAFAVLKGTSHVVEEAAAI
jgi:alkaline phosphatase D